MDRNLLHSSTFKTASRDENLDFFISCTFSHLFSSTITVDLPFLCENKTGNASNVDFLSPLSPQNLSQRPLFSCETDPHTKHIITHNQLCTGLTNDIISVEGDG